jgi:hypothetical protein
MPGSYKEINYNLRPAKSVERKMLCEALRRLIIFSDLTEYRYIGFGSTFFTDFLLIHKSLGVKDLVSIEKQVLEEERFKFNCPYGCVDLKFGKSNNVLPGLNWAKKTILWLDYEDPLENDMLTDIGTFFVKAQAGSIVLITIPVRPDHVARKTGEKSRYEQLTERIRKVKIPIDIKEKDLDKKNYPRVCFNIINNEIDEVLTRRNGGLVQKLAYKQLFNFYYSDSTPMLSFGGILYSLDDDAQLNKCQFNKLDFIKIDRTRFDPYIINVPNLTLREMRLIDKKMPSHDIPGLSRLFKFLPAGWIEDYSQIYRYIPHFVEAEMH